MQRAVFPLVLAGIILALGACARNSPAPLSSNEEAVYSGSSFGPEGAKSQVIDFSDPYRYQGNGGQ
jgi:hypothetical protein